jgi:hypothetical protein
MSEETARSELEYVLTERVERDRVVGVSPTKHELSTIDLCQLTDQVREAQEANVEIVWREDGTLIYEPWGAR